MEINVKMSSAIIPISLENLRKLVSDLEILAAKKIPHNERVTKILEHPEVVQREILVSSRGNYRVEDYALGKDEEEREIRVSVGSANYTPEDLRKINQPVPEQRPGYAT